jgi:hypothetical protein
MTVQERLHLQNMGKAKDLRPAQEVAAQLFHRVISRSCRSYLAPASNLDKYIYRV